MYHFMHQIIEYVTVSRRAFLARGLQFKKQTCVTCVRNKYAGLIEQQQRQQQKR